MKTKLEFAKLGLGDLRYAFDDRGPYLSVGGGKWPTQVFVDPFHGYAHDETTIRATAAQVAKKFPMDLTVTFYLSEFEPKERTNAWAQKHHDYDAPKKGDKLAFNGTIFVAGKRIPPHPAMSRYLVAHEYGHIVQYWMEFQQDKEEDGILTEYSELRGVTAPKHYGSRTWHASIGEMFANDFRILVCGIETEFWPHEGFSRPEQLPQVIKWWKEKVPTKSKGSSAG